jgi:predicted nucleic acid-binding protein
VKKYTKAISAPKIVAAFFDTNVLVYCTDTSAPIKQAVARDLVLQASHAAEAVLSTQVLLELFSVMTRKQRMPPENAQTLVLAYARWPVIQSDASLVTMAIEKSIQHQLSIWDAMVLEAALRSGSETLYSEDLQHGQRFGTLTVINPFL